MLTERTANAAREVARLPFADGPVTTLTVTGPAEADARLRSCLLADAGGRRTGAARRGLLGRRGHQDELEQRLGLGANSSGTAAFAPRWWAEPGAVTVQGPLFIGRSTRWDSLHPRRGHHLRGGGSLYTPAS